VLSPASPRFPLQFTVDQETYEMLGYAQELLGHVLRRGDLAQVFKRSLRTLITHLEKRKFAATDKPRTPRRRTSANKRHVPAEVKRAVWARDGGQCTFVSDAGRRCPSRTRLEFDHIDPVARGGEATVDRMRLRCRAHNQYTAECTYGAGFMERKRQEAGRATPQLSPGKATTHIRAAARAQLSPETVGAIGSPENDVVPWLRKLGFRADEARHAAARCEAMPDATLEERVRFALSTLSPGRRCMRAT
jgi:5-methylcytosine-specific restriction endonuclease McrA